LETLGLTQLVKQYWQPLLIVGGMVTALNIVNYTLLTYMPTYFEQQLGLEAKAALIVILLGELIMVACIPLAGKLSDRIERKINWYIALIVFAILYVSLFWLMVIIFASELLGYAILGLLFVLLLETISATFTSMFPTHARFAGFVIRYNIATALFCGTAAFISDFFVEITGSLLMPACYMVLACVIGLVSVYFMLEPAGAPLQGDTLPASVGSAVVP